jgi:hypothetical protein
MNWLIKSDMLGRGWFISADAAYYLYRDGTVDLFARDNVSCFWPTRWSAARFLTQLGGDPK